jgi:hypothetical protein
VAQHGPVSAGKQGGHVTAVLGRDVVAHEVDAAMELVGAGRCAGEDGSGVS